MQVIRVFILLLAGTLLFAGVPEAFAKSKRVALVVGNGAYPVGSLKNPPNDARLMANTLRGLDFDVIERVNLSQGAMKEAIAEFGARLINAGEDGVGLFYYAGHGVQARGKNYLIPVDSRVDREALLDIYAVSADWVLRQMEEAGNRVNLVILDACRNNPFVRSWSRSSSSGLARMEAPRGTLVAYATRPGEVAADGSGDNSPYTRALTDSMKKTGLTLSDVFIETRNAVMKETDDRQIPWEEGGLTSRFYFGGSPSAIGSGSTGIALNDSKAREISYWQSIQNSDQIETFETYIERYPGGIFADLAKLKKNELIETFEIAATRGWEVAPLDEDMVVLKTANVRLGPSTKKRKIGKLISGGVANVTGIARGDGAPWYRVAMADGQSGFVFGALLKEQQVAIPSSLTKTAMVGPKGIGIEEKGEPTSRKIFRDCQECPEMIVVPKGNFRMGDLSQSGHADENPVHRVSFSKPFAVGRYEVTFDEWDACVEDGGCEGYRPKDRKWGRGRNPAIYVSWNDAKIYVQWLTKKTGVRYRLLSEAEWEYVARAGTSTIYNFGSRASLQFANYDRDFHQTRPVGFYRENSFGLFDVHGNVWEWVEDCWNTSYAGAPDNGRAWVQGDCTRHVLRGGSWTGTAKFIRSSNRLGLKAAERYYFNGFRVARSLMR